MTDLADRLQRIKDSDHERGCMGRQYSCTCGYDDRKDALLVEAAAALALPVASTLSQHIGWLKQFIQGMDETNWQDMRLRAERQLDELAVGFAQDVRGSDRVANALRGLLEWYDLDVERGSITQARWDEAREAIDAHSPAEGADLTNHHNALKCPYCNPKGLEFARPAPDDTDTRPDARLVYDLGETYRVTGDKVFHQAAKRLQQLVSQVEDAAKDVRLATIEECRDAAFAAYGKIATGDYVLTGPAGIARSMLNAIDGLRLSDTSTDRKHGDVA